MRPTVFIGTLIRNCAWILPEWLDSIRSLKYEKKLIDLCFVINDSEDESENMINEFAKSHEDIYNKIFVVKRDFESAAVGHGSSRLNEDDPLGRGSESPGKRMQLFANLAELRNILLATLDQHSQAEWFFSCDSDILVEPETLNILLDDLKPKMRAALIINDWLQEKRTNFELNYRSTNAGIFMKSYNGRDVISHFYNYQIGEVHEIDLTGACFVIPKKIALTSKYDFHNWGEDAPFSIGLKNVTKELDTRTIPFHAMSKDLLSRRSEFEAVRHGYKNSSSSG